MRLLIIGQPGAGKGTQAALIKAHFPIVHISTGDMFREAIASNSKLGLEAKSYIEKGLLVPDALTEMLVKERLQKADVLNSGFLLDGFPRNLKQAAFLEKVLLEMNAKLDLVINIDTDKEVLIKRITGRRVCKDCQAVYHIKTLKPKKDGICDRCGGSLYLRKDDSEEIIRSRLQVYEENTKPLLCYYQEKQILNTFDGTKEVKEIFFDIKKVLEEIK